MPTHQEIDAKSGTLSLLEEAIFQQDFRAMEKRLAAWLMTHGEPSEASGLMERLPEEKARIFAGFLQWAAHGDWIPLSSVEPALAVARGRGLYDPAKLDIFERWGTDWRFDWHRMWQRQWEMVWRPPASESKPTPGLLYATCGGIVVTLHPEVNARAVEKRMEAGTLRTLAILGAIPAAGALRRDVVAAW